MADDPKTTDVPCLQPARYDRGECGWPACGCMFPDKASKAPTDRLANALEALLERAFRRCLFPREVKDALEALKALNAEKELS